MAFCPNCGAQTDTSKPFCTNCGAKIAPEQNQPQNDAQQPQPQYQQQPQPQYQQPGYQPQPQYAQPVYTPKPKVPGRGFGITSLVLGIIGVLEGLGTLFMALAYYGIDFFLDSIVVINVLPSIVETFIFAILTLIFGACAFARKYKNGVSITGFILGTITTIFGIASLALYVLD